MALIGNTNEQKIWNYFKSKGLNEFGCAGLMGNLQAESGLNSKNLQNTHERSLGYSDDRYVAAVDNGTYKNFIYDSAGFGLAQWTYWSRKKSLYEYAKSKNKSVGDLEMQLEFLYNELSTSYKSVLTTLKTATSVKDASNAVLLKFECPADQSVSVQNKRASYGQNYYNKYATNGNKEGESVMGYKTCAKGNAVKLSNNFDSTEFDCQGGGCCSSTLINETLVEYLQKIREHFGKSIRITSGYRCETHNSRVGTAGSRHTKGDAADFTVSGVIPAEVAKYAESIGAKGIGLYSDFVHIDTRTTKTFWYGHEQAPRSTFGGTTSGSNTTSGANSSSVTILSSGSHGSAVKELQENLTSLGYSCGVIDGDYGAKTACAVRKFQDDNGLKPVDGIAGQKTLEAIDKAIKSKSKKVKVTASALNVRAGAGTNYAVKGTVRKDSVHTLLEEKDGWGRISNGWISLEYVEKV